MNLNSPALRVLLVAACGALFGTSVGCQSTVGGQTLPSAFYLRDDVQFFPAGPEFKLTRQTEAIAEYNLRQKQAAMGQGQPVQSAETLPAAP